MMVLGGGVVSYEQGTPVHMIHTQRCVVFHHSSTSFSKDASIASNSSAACSNIGPSCVNSNVRPSFLPVPTVAHPRKSGLNRTHTSPFNPGSMVTQDSRLTPVLKVFFPICERLLGPGMSQGLASIFQIFESTNKALMTT